MIADVFGNRMKALALLLLVVAFDGIVSVTAVISWRRAHAAESQLNAYFALLRRTTQLLPALLHAEAGSRGYLLTGKPEYHASYSEGTRSIDEAVIALRGSEREFALEIPGIHEIASLASGEADTMREALRLGGGGNLPEAEKLLAAGRAQMEAARQQIRQQQNEWLGVITGECLQVNAASRACAGASVLGFLATGGLVMLIGVQRRRDTRGTQEALKLVKAEEQKYQSLAAHFQRIREEENGRLSRRVHDELGQALTAIRFDLTWLVKRIDPSDRQLVDQLNQSITLTEDTARLVRNIAMELRPAVLDQLGLVAALEWSCGEFQKRYNVLVTLSSDVTALELTSDQQLALYRIVQEALTNIARHADARNVAVRIGRKVDCLVLEVADDGLGIDPAKLDGHNTIGVLSMHERARLTGAALEIVSAPGAGTVVRVTVPANGASAAAAAGEGI